MARPKKRESAVTPERVRVYLRSRFNPIRGLTPESLSRQLDDFRAGYLREFAMTMDVIEDRDDILKCVAPKRKKSVARNDYDILTVEDSPRAKRHKDVLEHFYNNLTCTSAVNLNQRGGLRLLIRQMMDAVGKEFSVHEMIFHPSPEGLSAEFRFVPLWFFENRTGRLRFLEREGAVDGVDLDEGGWMITVGDGLMRACAVAFMYKHLPLRDWLIYSERHGMPGIQGKTDAKKNSTEWNDLAEAVQGFAAEFACVTSRDDSIEKIDMSTSGQLPYPKLVERMDRALSAIWRGADLSTLSADNKGASVQTEETDVLEADDAAMISETLNAYADKWAIYYATGDDQPLAYVQIKTSTRQDIQKDLAIDEFLVNHGAPVGITGTLERYGRPMPDKEDELLTPAKVETAGIPRDAGQATASNAKTGTAGTAVSNALEPAVSAGQSGTARPVPTLFEVGTPYQEDRLAANALDRLAAAQAEVLQPVRSRLAEIMRIDDPEYQRAALRNFVRDLPAMLEQVNREPGTADVIEGLIAAGLLNGAIEGAETRVSG